MNYVRPGKTRFASLLVLQSPALHCCLCSCVISSVRLEPKRYGAEYLADPPFVSLHKYTIFDYGSDLAIQVLLLGFAFHGVGILRRPQCETLVGSLSLQ